MDTKGFYKYARVYRREGDQVWTPVCVWVRSLPSTFDPGDNLFRCVFKSFIWRDTRAAPLKEAKHDHVECNLTFRGPESEKNRIRHEQDFSHHLQHGGLWEVVNTWFWNLVKEYHAYCVADPCIMVMIESLLVFRIFWVSASMCLFPFLVAPWKARSTSIWQRMIGLR